MATLDVGGAAYRLSKQGSQIGLSRPHRTYSSRFKAKRQSAGCAVGEC